MKKFIIFLICATACIAAGSDQSTSLPANDIPAPVVENKVVNVSPGNGTISAAVNANGGNTTYMLADGNYIDSNIDCAHDHMQFIGSGPANVKVTSSSPGQGVFNNGGTSDFFQIWGITIDCASGNGSAIDGNYSDLLMQNVHVQNYASTVSGQEDFPVFFYSTGYSPKNQTIDSCRFTPSSTGNVDGTSVIATGTYRPDGSNYYNVTISNNIFDTPTDHGTLYYHCVGSAQNIFGNTFVAPDFSFGAFFYAEPGSWNGNRKDFQDNSDNTSNITGNIVTLSPAFNFAEDLTSANGRSDSWVITGNTIHGNGSSAAIVHIWNGDYGPTNPPPTMINLTVQNNAIDPGMTILDASCPIGNTVTSPNDGIPQSSLTQSRNNAAVTTPGPAITDSGGNNWSITGDGNVSLNGNPVPANNASGVSQISYINGTVWKQDNSGNWNSLASNGVSTCSTTSPPCPIYSMPQYASVTTVGPTITDSFGNVWAISSDGKVSLNGSTSATSHTSAVVKLADVNSVVWYLDTCGNWYSLNPDGSQASGPVSSPLMDNINPAGVCGLPSEMTQLTPSTPSTQPSSSQ